MDVKDVQVKAESGRPVDSAKSGKPVQRALTNLSATTVNATRAEPVKVKVESNIRSNEFSQARKSANSVINVVNFVSEATSEIEALVNSVGGIVDQAKSENLPEQRVKVLEKEANQLVDEIKKKAQSPAPDGSRPLAGDTVRLDIEQRIGEALEVLLPSDASQAFGLDAVQLTPDRIINVIESVEKGKESLARLKEKVDATKQTISEAVSALEVAIENNAASDVSVRRLDDALSLGIGLNQSIRTEPDKALSSVGQLKEESAKELLK